MKKNRIDVKDYDNEIHNWLRKGVFLTTRTEDKVNSMVIGWGHIGRVWERDVFIAFVRENRFTREMLDYNPEFTINVPINGFDKEAFRICGSLSGREMDKIKESNLTLVESEKVSVPAIKEYPLTLECKVIYRQAQVLDDIPTEIYDRSYANEAFPHIMYFGEIVDAYILEEE